MVSGAIHEANHAQGLQSRLGLGTAGLVWMERVTQTTGSIRGTLPMRLQLLLQGPGLGTLRAAGSRAWPERPASPHSWRSEGCAARLPWAPLTRPGWCVGLEWRYCCLRGGAFQVGGSLLWMSVSPHRMRKTPPHHRTSWHSPYSA